MMHMPDNYFDSPIASSYDEKWGRLFEPSVLDPTVAFLAEMAGEGPVLELGIGTGRVALPLSRRGIVVHGIELSPAMVEQLRSKPGSGDIAVTVGDFATTRVEGDAFSLAYLVRNTIMNLTTQDEQVACFCNVADHLAPGGRFVVEVIVPSLRRLPPGETFHAFTVTPEHLGFDEFDVAAQGCISHHYFVSGDRVERFSVPFRFVWPAELDLMARIAGMRLAERWSDWARAPFTSASNAHVSVWEKRS